MFLGCSGFSLFCYSTWCGVTDGEELVGDGGGLFIGSLGIHVGLIGLNGSVE